MPERKTANKNASNDPKSFIPSSTITVKPAAGPLTPKDEPLIVPTIIPPTTPAIIPAKGFTLHAKAIPKHKGRATRNTTKPDGRSDLSSSVIFFSLFTKQI